MYFFTNEFVKDINTDNEDGVDGKFATAYAELMK